MQFFCHKIFRFSNCLNPFPQLLKHLKIILSSWTTEKQKIPGLPNPGLGHHCGLGSAALSYSNSPHTNIQYSFETTNLITTLSYLKSFSDYTTHRIVQIPSRGWQDLAWPLNLASTLLSHPLPKLPGDLLTIASFELLHTIPSVLPFSFACFILYILPQVLLD